MKKASEYARRSERKVTKHTAAIFKTVQEDIVAFKEFENGLNLIHQKHGERKNNEQIPQLNNLKPLNPKR